MSTQRRHDRRTYMRLSFKGDGKGITVMVQIDWRMFVAMLMGLTMVIAFVMNTAKLPAIIELVHMLGW
jgi:hypothetical protein